MRLTILLFDGYTALDIVGGYEVLARLPGIDTEFVAPRKGVVAADTRRLGLVAWRDFADVAQTDILYVPGGPGGAGAIGNPALLDFVRAMDAKTSWTIGICNGVEILGAAGLLTGREVTTNWACRDRVAAYGAHVQARRYCRDGKYITGAGVSASMDTAFYLAEIIAGAAYARILQLGLEYYPDPPLGNGTPDAAPPEAQAMIRKIEANPQMVLAQRQAPFQTIGQAP